MALQDHINSAIFDLLWERTPDKDAHFAVRIPDTVLYRHRVPVRYYFTNKAGCIMRKKDSDSAAIEQRFQPPMIMPKQIRREAEDGAAPAPLQNGIELDICAIWHGGVPVDDRVAATHHTVDGVALPSVLGLDTLLTLADTTATADLEASPDADPPRVRFIAGRDELKAFLRDISKEDSGVLQRFVMPRAPATEVMRCNWSPYPGMVSGDRMLCKAKLTEMKHATVAGRVATFEGGGHDSTADLETCRSEYMLAAMTRACEEIAGHVANITHRLIFITYMQAHFKVDARERLVLLWVSNVKVRKGAGGVNRPLSMPAAGSVRLGSAAVVQRQGVSPKRHDDVVSESRRSPSGAIAHADVFDKESDVVEAEEGTNWKLRAKKRLQGVAALDTHDADGNETSDAVVHAVHVLMSDARPRAPHAVGGKKIIPVVADGQKAAIAAPKRSAFDAMSSASILPLAGASVQERALAQGERERYAMFVGIAVSHTPLWECPSCGGSATAAELQGVPARTVVGHYTALLTHLHLRPRELEPDDDVDVHGTAGRVPQHATQSISGQGGTNAREQARRRNSDGLPADCYWPVKGSGYDRVKYLSGGVGAHFAYAMPTGYVRRPAALPNSLADYMDRWLFMRNLVGGGASPDMAAGRAAPPVGMLSPRDSTSREAFAGAVNHAKDLFADILARGGSVEKEDEGRPKTAATIALVAARSMLIAEPLPPDVRRRKYDVAAFLSSQESKAGGSAQFESPVHRMTGSLLTAEGKETEALAGPAASSVEDPSRPHLLRVPSLLAVDPDVLARGMARDTNNGRDQNVVDEDPLLFGPTLFGLSPGGRAVVRLVPPTIARAFPDLTLPDFSNMLMSDADPAATAAAGKTGKPAVKASFGTTGTGAGSDMQPVYSKRTRIPVCGDCYCAFQAFADSVLEGRGPEQALSTIAARYARLGFKASHIESLRPTMSTTGQMSQKRVPSAQTSSRAEVAAPLKPISKVAAGPGHRAVVAAIQSRVVESAAQPSLELSHMSDYHNASEIDIGEPTEHSVGLPATYFPTEFIDHVVRAGTRVNNATDDSAVAQFVPEEGGGFSSHELRVDVTAIIEQGSIDTVGSSDFFHDSDAMPDANILTSASGSVANTSSTASVGDLTPMDSRGAKHSKRVSKSIAALANSPLAAGARFTGKQGMSAFIRTTPGSVSANSSMTSSMEDVKASTTAAVKPPRAPKSNHEGAHGTAVALSGASPRARSSSAKRLKPAGQGVREKRVKNTDVTASRTGAIDLDGLNQVRISSEGAVGDAARDHSLEPLNATDNMASVPPTQTSPWATHGYGGFSTSNPDVQENTLNDSVLTSGETKAPLQRRAEPGTSAVDIMRALEERESDAVGATPASASNSAMTAEEMMTALQEAFTEATPEFA